jgi:ABC-type Na+ efflux pump permease subunit
MLGPVMAGMMIMFVFFTGASSASSLITENEEGTLSRLCTTPTSLASILGGKFIAVLLILVVQVAVLMAAARPFNITGAPAPVGLMAAGWWSPQEAWYPADVFLEMRQAGPVMRRSPDWHMLGGHSWGS